jgi:hypothetical protein
MVRSRPCRIAGEHRSGHRTPSLGATGSCHIRTPAARVARSPWFSLFGAQIHTAKNLPAGTGPNTVQGWSRNGQLLLMKVRDWGDVFGDLTGG